MIQTTQLTKVVTHGFRLADLAVELHDIEAQAHMGECMPFYEEFIRAEVQKLNAYTSIQGAYVLVEAETCSEKGKVALGGKQFTLGKRIAHYLKNSSYYALFICTGGQEVSQRVAQLNAQGDLLEGYLVDVLGTVMVEKAMDKIQEQLSQEMAALGLQVSNRYSPGYCNWDVSEQNKLFSFFPPKHCGISLSESCLMHPIKSVSGILGIGQAVRFREHACADCNSTHCVYRNVR